MIDTQYLNVRSVIFCCMKSYKLVRKYKEVKTLQELWYLILAIVRSQCPQHQTLNFIFFTLM